MEFIFRKDEYTKKSTRAEGEWAHNRIYRGNDLGTFNDTYEQAIADGTFDNMYIGDTFAMGGHNYTIGGFNYKYGHENNTDLGNHILMIADNLGNYPMNSVNSTSGGFAGMPLFKDTLPKIEAQLKADWGDHLLAFNSYLSTGIDSNGAPNNGAWFNLTANLMNSVMVFGAPTAYSNNANGMKYNIGDEDDILPLFKLHPDSRKYNNWWWLRDIYNSASFAYVNSDGTADTGWYTADNTYGVRAFFLIN